MRPRRANAGAAPHLAGLHDGVQPAQLLLERDVALALQGHVVRGGPEQAAHVAVGPVDLGAAWRTSDQCRHGIQRPSTNQGRTDSHITAKPHTRASARSQRRPSAIIKSSACYCPLLPGGAARRGRAWSRSMWSTPRRSRLPSTAFWMCAGVTRVSPSFLRYLLPYPATCTAAPWQRSTTRLARDGARRHF